MNSSLDELVRTLLPRDAIPRHLQEMPSQVLDPDYEPSKRRAPAVLALREIVARAPSFNELGPRLASSRDVTAFFSARIGQDRVESIAIVGLDARLRVVFHRIVSRGGVASCPVRIADLLRPILINAAHGALMVHNHPSSDPTPSTEDLELTHRVRASCETLGISLVDHVIVTRDPSVSFSFRDAHLLNEPIDESRLAVFRRRGVHAAIDSTASATTPAPE